jgi:hypothetical protein
MVQTLQNNFNIICCMPLFYFSRITKDSVYGKPRGKCKGGENIFYNSSKSTEKQ